MAQYQNVSDLYTDVQKYVDTKEAYFISKIPAWVYFAETELDRRLRHPAAEKVDVFTVSAGYDYLTAPKNLLELKSIRNRSNNQILYRQSYEKIYDVQNYSNQPIAFASVSNK
ncbi:phage adaptor protein, partial [Klebsiella pneumoniae]